LCAAGFSQRRSILYQSRSKGCSPVRGASPCLVVPDRFRAACSGVRLSFSLAARALPSGVLADIFPGENSHAWPHVLFRPLIR
jgi:hypothetical protein